MKAYNYVYGPVPSRRLGLSLGISPIPPKTCNYSCVYCQLGRTDKLTNKRSVYFEPEDIIKEVQDYIKEGVKFDVVTLVGEGEPTLYARLGDLINDIKKITRQPVAVITNGGLMSDKSVREELAKADIVTPSLDACSKEIFKKINRPYGKIEFTEVYQGLKEFSQSFEGQLWLETMIVKGINDDRNSLFKLKELLEDVRYNRLYINTPVRPPAEKWVQEPSREALKVAVEILGGTPINELASTGFYSEEKDDIRAVLSIIKRHPMNQHEITSFLQSRGSGNINRVFEQLNDETGVERIDYKGYITYRLVK